MTTKRMRTQIVREDAGETAVLSAPMPPNVAYGEIFHCPNCGTSYKNPRPKDPIVVCSFCTQRVDLSALTQPKPAPELPAR